MKELRFMCAQPATPYYVWQVEVMLNNFLQMGVNLNRVDIICSIPNSCNCERVKSDKIPDAWLKLTTNYAARFFFYEDTRQQKNYQSSIRPNILKQHWQAHSYLKEQAIFYHDCDIIFTKPPSNWITKDMINDEDWYGSDTKWYIAHTYIKSKGQDVLDAMCEIMNLNEKLILDNELNSIGSQYLMKNIDYAYWDRVEKDSEKLFTEITKLNNQKQEINPDYHELQIWCADMWAVLWGAWRLGYKTICHLNFNFSWATSNEDDYNNANIMHNAGVTNNKTGLFYKSDYINEYPYNKDLQINETGATRHYWDLVQETANKTVLI